LLRFSVGWKQPRDGACDDAGTFQCRGVEVSRTLKRYRRRERTEISAVQLSLNTDGFTYEKWGGTQRCSAGDWIVDNQGDVYTVAAESFARTYRCVGPGRYVKHARVWAEQATGSGTVTTKEGSTRFSAGDFIVHNARDGSDGYAMTKERFHALYELDTEAE
jgi:hypothetical protein